MKDEMNTNFSADADDQISGLIAGLPRVSAPADFDLRLRGRIARQRSAVKTGFRMPAALTYALGLGVVLVAFGLFGLAYIYSGKVGDVPEVATAKTAAPITTTAPPTMTTPSLPPTSNTVVPPQSALTASSEMPAARKPDTATVQTHMAANTVKATASPAPTVEAVADAALRTAKKICPAGIPCAEPNSTPEMSAQSPVDNPHDAKEVLAVLGVNAAFAGGKMLIGSVNAGSIAENAGLKAGDVVQSINDQAVNEGAKFAGSFKASVVRVLREGKVIGIAIGK